MSSLLLIRYGERPLLPHSTPLEGELRNLRFADLKGN